MSKLARLRRPKDLGMATAEYAIGTVAACSFGGVLYKFLSSDQGQKIVEAVFEKAFGWLF